MTRRGEFYPRQFPSQPGEALRLLELRPTSDGEDHELYDLTQRPAEPRELADD